MAKQRVVEILVRIATPQNDLSNAEGRFEMAVVFFHDNEITANAFAGFAELIDVCEQRGSKLRAIEWCEQTIEFADRTEHATDGSTLRSVDRNWLTQMSNVRR